MKRTGDCTERESRASGKSVIGYRIRDAKLGELMRDRDICAVYVKTDTNNIYRIDARGRIETAKGKKVNASMSPTSTLREGGNLVYGVAGGFFMRRIECVYYAGKITEIVATYRGSYHGGKVTALTMEESKIAKDFEAIKRMGRKRISGQTGSLKGDTAGS